MIDLAEIWAWLRSERGQAAGAALTLPDIIKKNAELFEDFMLPARVQVEQDECFGPMFEFYPRPDVASSKSWVWVIAVRSGWLREVIDTHEYCGNADAWWDAGWPVEFFVRHPDARDIACKAAHDCNREVHRLVTAAERGAFHSKFGDMRRRAGEDFSFQAQMEAIGGSDIVELVAVSANFSKILGRFLAASPVIGYPLHPECEERPVRLFRDLKSFLAGLCGGALLIGNADDNYRWMAACDGGIVCDDVAHGKSVKKILTRPYRGPQVLVAG